MQVISVHKVQNPLLWGLYTLRKNEMEINTKNIKVNEWLLYHVTATKNVQSIAENNLDWRFTNRCRYGKGVCFSYCPLYANRYASCAQGRLFTHLFNIIKLNVVLSLKKYSIILNQDQLMQ